MNMHEKYMAALYDALAKHPEVDINLVDIVETAELDHFNKHDRHEWRDIDKHRTTKIDIINNFEYYKNLCQEELWDMLNRESRYLIKEALKHIGISAYRPSYDDIASCINDKEAIKKHKYHCEVLLRKGKRNQVLINSLK